MEEKYWELREAEERAFDKYCRLVDEQYREEWLAAKERFHSFCVDVLEKLAEENSEALARLNF